MSKQADKTVNPLSSPEAQSHKKLPEGEASLEQADPRTEKIDKVVTPTSIKEKERQANEIKEKLSDVENDVRKG